MSESKHQYRGQALTVTWDQRKCIHNGACVRGLPQVFDPKARPWVSPDAAAGDALAKVITDCPTGALTFERHDGGPAEQSDTNNEVTLAKDGPAYLRGDVVLVDGQGGELARTPRAALCRCGASKNKPFCDNSHDDANFRDAGLAADPRLAGSAEAGCLTIKIAPNGPLIIDGPVALRDAQGTVCASGAKGALCRCGESANKPFCDGADGRVGFEAP